MNGVRWENNITPADTLDAVRADYEREVMQEFVRDLKARAGGRTRPGSGRIPVLTGNLRDSLRLRAMNIVGAAYGLIVDQRGGGIFLTAWRAFPKQPIMDRVLRRHGIDGR